MYNEERGKVKANRRFAVATLFCENEVATMAPSDANTGNVDFLSWR